MKYRKWLLAVVFLGFLLRCFFLEERSIQYDDAFSILLAKVDLASIIKGTAADTMPPLYYFLLHFWMFVSTNIWWLRFLSVILSLLGLFFLYKMIHFLFGERAAIWASFLAAISPIQIYHGQDVRMYALLQFTQLGYAYCFLRIRDSENRKQISSTHFWGLIIFGTLSMYTHNLAIFILVIPDMILIIQREWQKLKVLVIAQLIIGFLTIPWLIYVPGQVEKIQSAFWTPRPGLVEILQMVVMFVANLPLQGLLLMIGVVVSVFVFILVFIVIWQKRYYRGNIFYILIFMLFPPTIYFIVSYVMRPIFVTRGLIFSTMSFYGLAGFIISKNQKRITGILILSSFVLAALITLPGQYKYNQFPRSPFREMTTYLQSVTDKTDIILHDNKLSYFPSIIYAPEFSQEFIADEPGSHNDTLALDTQYALGIFPKPDLNSATETADVIYFILFKRTITEFQEMGFDDHPNLELLKGEYQLENSYSFNDLVVYRFSK
jgi:hypothetical protein